MIQTGSGLALTDTGVNFEKIPYWGNHVKSSRNVWRLSNASYSYTSVSVYVPYMSYNYGPRLNKTISKYERWKRKLWDYLNKLVYRIFRSFIGIWVTFWKHHRLRKPGPYWLPMRLRFLSNFCSVGTMTPSLLKTKNQIASSINTKLRTEFLTFASYLKKNLYEYNICYAFRVFFWSSLLWRPCWSD